MPASPRSSTAPAWRVSRRFLDLLTLSLVLFGLTFLHAGLAQRSSVSLVEKRAALVAELDLTDLALFTEARYTRHPSQADLHSAFQDHPMAIERFPSGSLMPPVSAGFGR